MNNLFQRLCSVRSFLLSRTTGSFHFRTGQAKFSQAHFYSIHFLKVRYFPEKIDNKPLPGVFPKKLAPLAKKLVKLDYAVVSMVFQELCHIFSHFS